MKKTVILLFVAALGVGTMSSCKKKKANKRIVGTWKATSYSESTNSTDKNAKWYVDQSFNNVKGIETTTIANTQSLGASKNVRTVVDPLGVTDKMTTDNAYVRTITLTLNDDGTMVKAISDQLTTTTLTNSPAVDCAITGGSAGIDCDGIFTYTTDNTMSSSVTGIWYWGNNTTDRGSVTLEYNGNVEVWTVDALEKKGTSLILSRTDKTDWTKPDAGGAGSDVFTETITYKIELAQ